jgi:predicted phosphodiesterase
MNRQMKEVHRYDIDTGDYIESFEGVGIASEAMNYDASTIAKAARGNRKSAANSYWSYEKHDNYDSVNLIDSYARSHGIDPDDIVKARVTETKEGERIGFEIKRTKQLTEKELSSSFVQNKAKLLQRKQDELRVTKKYFREYARVENTLIALNEALIDILNNESFKPITYEHPEREGTALVVQLTDLHFNELVEMPDNEFGFKVGAKRLQRYAHKIKMLAETFKVKNIVVAITGDIINSDRRLDEKIHMATNRMKASLIATQILYHFLQDINRVANLSIVSVSGNESRINEEFGLSEFLMSDNYDFLIYNMLKQLFKEAKAIKFIDGDPVEQVINVNNCNFLITHGTTIKEGQAAMQQVFGKYAAKGILLDYAIFGHIHFTNITDIYSRSGSLIGNNIYSDRNLNLITKASQVVHVVETDGTIDNVKIGLQYVGDYEGYDIKDDLKAYNPKLADNTKQRTTIVKVVI